MFTIKVSMNTGSDSEYIIDAYATREGAIRALIEWRTNFPFCHAFMMD